MKEDKEGQGGQIQGDYIMLLTSVTEINLILKKKAKGNLPPN